MYVHTYINISIFFLSRLSTINCTIFFIHLCDYINIVLHIIVYDKFKSNIIIHIIKYYSSAHIHVLFVYFLNEKK